MESNRRGSPKKRHVRPLPNNIPDTQSQGVSSAGNPSRLDLFFAPFRHRKTDSTKIFSELAPAIMTPKMMNHAATVSSRPKTVSSSSDTTSDFAALGRAPRRFTLKSKRLTSRDLQIVEGTDELLETEVPQPDGVASNVSLLRGFNATIPSADKGRSRRRQTRNVDAPTMGLKKLGLSTRGLLAEEEDQRTSDDDDVVVVGKPDANGKLNKSKRRGRESIGASKILGREELKRQTSEIVKDKENLQVRRTLINSEIAEITHKIEALDAIRSKLEQDLLKLQEDELELDDELEGVQERMDFENSNKDPVRAARSHRIPQSSRRRKGPAFLPSEHDELPPGIAFMTLSSHTTPITALDISEPYGTLVSASQEDTQPRVWDLLSGEEIARLRGHAGTVKCVQVEDHVCLTGSEDCTIKLWDLRRVGDDDWHTETGLPVGDAANDDGEMIEKPSGVRDSDTTTMGDERVGPLVRSLEGHSRAVTALYFEDDCLVTGASDKTMRQWDLNTGQCVMTMDMLWAISHPQHVGPASEMSSFFPDNSASSGTFSVATPPYADGSWEMYQDFVGALQFWEYALVSGSGDGAVRMWDMRTGQTHRTLVGHTAPVTCLQFDEMHIVSGSLDKSLRIWDLRSGSIFETIKYDHAVTGLQFDTRKIIVAAGENNVKIYNRITMQQSSLLTNGHTRPVERLRYIDRYLVSGGRDATIKIWSL